VTAAVRPASSNSCVGGERDCRRWIASSSRGCWRAEGIHLVQGTGGRPRCDEGIKLD
jgi:hypothetical protein